MINKRKIENWKTKQAGFTRTPKSLVSGFTLVEMLIAVTLFVIIMTISIGALLSVFDANKKARTSKTVVDNLNLSIENMARTVRFGSTYHCDVNDLPLNAPDDCDDNVNGSDFLAVQFNGSTIVYRLCGTAINKSETGNTTCSGSDTSPITSTDTTIERLRFYVFGANEASGYEQPYVVAVIKGYVGDKPTIQTKFSIETLLSQRTLDI